MLGDLEEEFLQRTRSEGEAAAARWYRRQVLRSLLTTFATRVTSTAGDLGMGQTLSDSFGQDVRHALRTFARNPGFAGVAVLTLGLGIGAATAVFTVFESVLLRPLPYPEPERLYHVSQDGDAGSFWLSSPNLEDLRRGLTSFEDVAAYSPEGANMVVGGEPVRIELAEVSANYFSVLGVAPALGRTFSEDEQRTGAGVVVVSHQVWQARLGGRPDALGRALTLDGRPREVIGVLPPLAMVPPNAEVWIPLSVTTPDWRASRGISWLQAVGRLRAGASIDVARTEAQTLAASLRTGYPDVNRDLQVGFRSLQESVVGSVRTDLRVMMAGVLLVLLVSAMNVGGLLLARSSARRQEVTVRSALGCGRRRLALQLLTESAVLAALGGAVGVALGRVGVALLTAQAPPGTPRLAEIRMHGGALLFALAISAGAALLIGALPALQSMRGARTPLATGRRATAGSRVARSTLVVVQSALALVLLTGAGLLGKSFWRLQQVDTGFDASGVLVAGLPVVERDFVSPVERVQHFRSILEAASGLPGVRSAALTNSAPFVSSGPFFSYELPDMPATSGQQLMARFRVVTPELFEALDIPVLRGRAFTDLDLRPGGERVAVVSEELVAVLAGRDVIGQRIRILGDPHRIVGIVGSIRDLTLREPSPFPHVYVPFLPESRQSFTLVLRVDGDPAALMDPLRRAVAALAPTQPVTPSNPLDAFMADSVARARFTLWLLSFFAGATVLLAGLGLYGLLSYVVGQETREIGVRMTLGATKARVRAVVVGRGMRLTLVGLVVGVVLSRWAGTLLEALLFEVEPVDPPVLAAVGGILLVAAALASWLPARRATRISPGEALRSD